MDGLDMWRDGAREDVIRVQMVDPFDVDRVRGELAGVVTSGCSITEGYYTDSRVTAKVRAYEDGYVGDSWLRIVHECPAYGYRAELGTFVVTKASRTSELGGTVTDYDLQSVLWAVSKDTLPCHWSVGEGALAREAFARICETVGKAHAVLPGAMDYRFAQTVVYELGDSFLSDLFDVADRSGNRVDVDGHGRITLGRYVAPSQREPDWVLDLEDPRGLVLAGGVSWAEEPGSVVNRVIVKHTNGESEVVGSADAAQTRGYTVAEVKSVQDLSPETPARASQLAREYLQRGGGAGREYSVSALYFPVHEGDVVRLVTDGVRHDCLVKEADVSLADMTVDLTLKEA